MWTVCFGCRQGGLPRHLGVVMRLIGTRPLVTALAAAVAALPVLGLAAPASAAGEVTAVSADAASTYQTNGIVWALASVGNTVFVGGTFTSVRPGGAAAGVGEVPRANFAAFDATSGALLPCAPAFTLGVAGATVRALTASGDGSTLYVGGYFGTAGGVGVSNLAALNVSSCAVSGSFHPGVAATVRAIATNAGSPVYFGGDFNSVSGQPRGLTAAVTAAGALLPWSPNAVAPPASMEPNPAKPIYTSVRALTVSADNSRVVIGGDFETVGGQPAHRLVIVDPTTAAVVQTFPGFIDRYSAVKTLVHDDTHFYLGGEGTGGGVFDGRAEFDIYTGALVWRDNCLGATQAVLPYNGVLYSASHAHDCTPTPGGYPDGARHHLLAQSIADKTILPWFPNTNDGIGERIGPRALTMAGGYLWLGGEFTTVNGVAQQFLTRFAPRPGSSVPAAPVPNLASINPGAVQVRWRTVADVDDGTLTYRLYRDGVLVDTQSGDSRFWDRPQMSFTDAVTAGSFHVYRMTVSDGVNTSPLGGTAGITAASTTASYPAKILADSPNLYWRLDEAAGPFAADTSTGNYAGVYSSSGVAFRQPGGVPGDADTGVVLDGSTGSVASWTPLVGPQTYSLEVRFQTTTTSGGKLIGFGSGSTGNAGAGRSGTYDRHVYMTNAGQLVFGNYAAGTQTAQSPASYNDGGWHRMVATSGPAGMHLYVDGVQVASNPNTAASAYRGYWHVGNDSVAGWPSAPTSTAFAGSVDEVAVYPSQLTAAQVAAHG